MVYGQVQDQQRSISRRYSFTVNLPHCCPLTHVYSVQGSKHTPPRCLKLIHTSMLPGDGPICLKERKGNLIEVIKPIQLNGNLHMEMTNGIDHTMILVEPPQKLALIHIKSKALLMTLLLSHPPQLIMHKL